MNTVLLPLLSLLNKCCLMNNWAKFMLNTSTLFSLVGLVLMGCTGAEKNVTTTNQAPEASITSHSDGVVLPEGEAILFTGAVSDSNHSLDDLLVTWYAGTDILCAEGPPEVDATARCEGVLTEDVTSITLAVRDPDNARSDAVISVEVVPTNAPEAEITSPTVDGLYYSDEIITFTGTISDSEDDPTDLIAYWTSSIDGDLTGVDATANSNGEILGYGNLSEGQHILELHVEDSTGKVNKASLIVEVGAANSAPTCSIDTPVTNSSGLEGEMITFQGTAADEDQANNELTVVWASDKDGELGTSVPNASGGVTFPYDTLSMNTHLVSMTVTDTAGETCVADMLYTVGSPPTIVLTEPATASAYNEGDAVNFVVEVSDSEDIAANLTLEWSSSIDGVFSTQQAASNGIAQLSTNTFSSGSHVVTVTVTDSNGLYAEALTNFTVNGVPTQPTVTINPNPASSSDVLTAVATGSVDPEGASITYAYEWLLNGSSSGFTGTSLASSSTAKGDIWTVRATPTDGTTTGPYGEAVTTIINEAPVLSSVNITPSNPSPQDDLTCAYSAMDADGDPVSVTYQWSMGSNTLSSTTDTLSGPFQQGDSLTCTVTPYDGFDYGAPVDSTVTVNNTPPVVTSLTVTPTTVLTDDVLTATGSGTDADGDTLSYGWDWYVDSGTGFSLVQSNSGANADTLDGVFHFDRGDQVYVIMTITDGSSSATQTSPTTTVQNTAPSAYNVIITPGGPIAGVDDLECIAQGADADGDSVTFTYAWEVDGVVANYASAIIATTELTNGEVWECIATPDDGTVSGTPNSGVVTIGAAIPGTTGSGMCAAAGYTTDSSGTQTILCLSEVGVSGEETTDATYTWQPGSIYLFSPE